MASTVVATVGASTSNSYVTVAEGTTYFADHPDGAQWAKAGATKQAQAVMYATRRIDREDFMGTPVNPLNGTSSGTTQALKFPRFGTYSDDGEMYLQTVIPVPVKEATYELAMAMLKGEYSMTDTGLEGFKSVKAGSLEVEPRLRSAGALPATVKRLLASVRISSGGLNVSVLRG